MKTNITNEQVAVLQPNTEPSKVTLRRTVFGTSELTMIRQCGPEPLTHSPVIQVPCEDAFSIITQLADFKSHKLWRGKRLMHAGGHARSSIAITHMVDEWRCQHLSAFDNFRFHIPRSAIDAFTYDAGQKRIARFDIAPDQLDPVVFHLAQALLPAFASPEYFNRLQFDHLVLALYAYVTTRYGRTPRSSTGKSGKLATWQESRAKEYMRSNLMQNLSLEQIAHECGLSRAHFARNFKNTTGVAAHEWLQCLRIDQAKLLLTEHEQTLAQIALNCGFVDQSHFTRVFKNVVGTPPGMWRRMAACLPNGFPG